VHGLIDVRRQSCKPFHSVENLSRNDAIHLLIRHVPFQSGGKISKAWLLKGALELSDSGVIIKLSGRDLGGRDL